MKKFIILSIIRLAPTMFLELLAYCALEAQGLGIGTSNPQEMLHVAGSVRIDSVELATDGYRIAALDSNGTICSIPQSALSPGNLVFFSSANEGLASTASDSPQSRAFLVLPPGEYLLFGYFETYSMGTDAGTRAWMHEGASEIAYGIVYSNTGTFGSWSSVSRVQPVTSTQYTLSWSAWPQGNVSWIRRARIYALRIG